MAVRDFGHALRLFLLLPLARLDILDPHIMFAQEFSRLFFCSRDCFGPATAALEVFYKVVMLDPLFMFAQEGS